MPAKGSTDTNLLPSRIQEWLTAHPGEHRTRDVAEGLGRPDGVAPKDWTLNVGRALSRLALSGSVARTFKDLGHKKPTGHYSAPTKD